MRADHLADPSDPPAKGPPEITSKRKKTENRHKETAPVSSCAAAFYWSERAGIFRPGTLLGGAP